MGDRYSQMGNDERDALRFVLETEGIEASMADYDKAPQAAEKFFSDIKDDDEAIQERFYELFLQETDDSKQKELGCAYNYAMISATMRNGNEDFAKGLIKTLVEKDRPCSILDWCLNFLGTSYSEQCVKRKSLLTPKQLDEIVFETFAPDFKQYSGSYAEGNGIAIAEKIEHENKEYYFAQLFFDRSSAKSIDNSEKGYAFYAMQLGLGSGVLHHEGNFAQFEEKVKEEFDQKGIKDYKLIVVNDPRMKFYLMIRFMIQKQGKFIRTALPIRAKREHELMDIDIDDEE